MHPAPYDLAETLPGDWIEQLLALRPPAPAAAFVSLVQDVLRQRGEHAIGLQRVQEMALWLTRRRGEGEPFRWLPPLAERLAEAAGGTWPIEVAAGERRSDLPRKPRMAIADDLDAIVAELAVLDALVQRGARPVRDERSAGSFDWRVEREGQPLPVEVKQKASRGMVGHRLEWFWKGVSLLPRGAFIRNYEWHWHASDALRAEVASQMMDALWRGTDELRDKLPIALEQSRGTARWELDMRLTDGRLRVRPAHYVASERNVAIELSTDPSVAIDVRINPHPEILASTGINGGWLKKELGADEKRALGELLRRLNIERQARNRAETGLYVVVWWVPTDWEPALGNSWPDTVCDDLARPPGPRYVAIEPLGMFEARQARWGLSAAAQRDLPWLLK